MKGYVNTTYSAVVSIKITNVSSYPITIDEISLCNETYVSKQGNDFKFKYIEIPNEDNTQVVYIDTYQISNLPLKIEPFQTVFAAFAFPHFDDFVTRYGNTIFADMQITTPRKKHTIKVEIPEYHSLFTR